MVRQQWCQGQHLGVVVPYPMVKSLPLCFGLSVVQWLVQAWYLRSQGCWTRGAEPALLVIADFFRHCAMRKWPPCFPGLPGLQSTAFLQVGALQTEIGDLDWDCWYLAALWVLKSPAASLLMPSELTGCLCLLPSALGFRKTSLMELPRYVGMWSQPELSTALEQITPLLSGAWESSEQAPKNHCRTQIGFGRFISSGLVPALLGPDWINWDACALQLRDNCITEIYLLLKVSPPLSSIRKRGSYAESHRIWSKVTAWFYAWFMYEFALGMSGFIQCRHKWK